MIALVSRKFLVCLYFCNTVYISRNVLLIVLWVNGVIGQHVLKPALTLSKAWTVFPRKFGQEKLYRNQMDQAQQFKGQFQNLPPHVQVAFLYSCTQLGSFNLMFNTPGPWLMRFFSLGKICMNQIRLSKIISDQRI